ncbi:MAG: hypothetical protein F6K39_28660 [Okeania sp. SIO3B3]|nr:hypothetical protein [Okeania sp. SIO3B3]
MAFTEKWWSKDCPFKGIKKREFRLLSILITEKFWFKASPFKGIINKKFPLSQSSSFQGEVIINY